MIVMKSSVFPAARETVFEEKFRYANKEYGRRLRTFYHSVRA